MIIQVHALPITIHSVPISPIMYIIEAAFSVATMLISSLLYYAGVDLGSPSIIRMPPFPECMDYHCLRFHLHLSPTVLIAPTKLINYTVVEILKVVGFTLTLTFCNYFLL